jgi:hypothetical protein
MRRIARALAILGVATAGVLVPLGAAADAGTATEATASPEIGTAAVRYGGYRDLGTCNYWKNALRAAGYRTSNCYLIQHTCPGGCDALWYFTRY